MADLADPIVIELAIARQARGLSLRDVAVTAGIGAASICQWETGSRSPNLRGLRAYARALGRDLVLEEVNAGRPDTGVTAGPCARCRRTCTRYGPAGRPVCDSCAADDEGD